MTEKKKSVHSAVRQLTSTKKSERQMNCPIPIPTLKMHFLQMIHSSASSNTNDGLKTPTKDKINDSNWYDGIYNISSFVKVIQDLVTSNSSLSQLIASERANNTALIKENIALRTQIQELSSQIGGQTMENKGELTSLRFMTEGHRIPDFGGRVSGAMGSDIAGVNPLSPFSPCVAADNPICQNIGTQAGNVKNFQDQLKEVLREKHEKYLLMKSNKCEKSVDNVNDKSNVIPNSSKNSTSREFNNVNIVTESILIQHPEGKQKTKRANKRKRRKAIATEATTSKKKNVSDPQKADDKTCSSPQVTDYKATDSKNQFDLMRRDLFRQLTIPGLDINKLDSDALCSLLLFGSKDLNVVENRIIIEATISFINATKRFD